MEYKKFNDVNEARQYRELQRQNGYASSVFNYGNDRYMTHTATDIKHDDKQSWYTRGLNNRAWEQNYKLTYLTKLKEMIDSQPIADFYTVIEHTEDALVFLKPIVEDWNYFTAREIISFLERPDDYLPKIKEYVEDELNQYDVEWEEL